MDLTAGWRLGEILTLRWEYVDFDHGLLRLPESKTGTIVLGPPAIKLLSETKRKKGSVWVCPGERGPDHIADRNGPWRRLKAKVDELQDKEEEEGNFDSLTPSGNTTIGTVGGGGSMTTAPATCGDPEGDTFTCRHRPLLVRFGVGSRGR